MAKTSAPLLSFGAKGQIGNAQVYSSWKGIPTARKYTVPSNPNSTEQQKTRGVFGYLNALWKLLPADAQAPWNAFITGKPLINRNAFISMNLPDMRGAANNNTFVGSPGNGGAVAPTAIALADAGGGTHHITVTMTVPTVPAGWTITDSQAVAVIQEDPNTSTIVTSYYGHSGDALGVVTINAAAGTWVVAGWFKFAKPDGSVAYGPSLTNHVVIA